MDCVLGACAFVLRASTRVQVFLMAYPAQALWVRTPCVRKNLVLVAGLLERYVVIGALAVTCTTIARADGYAWKANRAKLLLLTLISVGLCCLAAFLNFSADKLNSDAPAPSRGKGSGLGQCTAQVHPEQPTGPLPGDC